MSELDDREAAQWREARRWFAFVEEDLRAAEACLAMDPPVVGPSAYHCQQAAEKIIKALLIAASRPILKIHDLKELSNAVAPDYPGLAGRMTELRDLTLWGFAYRYPFEEEVPVELPTIEGVRRAIQKIQELFAAARALDPYAA